MIDHRLSENIHGELSIVGVGETAYTGASGRTPVAMGLEVSPYISALIVPDEAPGVRIVSRLVDCAEGDLRPDAPVRVRFVDLGYPAVHTGIAAPLFTLDRSS